MDSPRIRHRTIALIAAYALALQGLLLAFVPAGPVSVAGPFATLCVHNSGGGGGQDQPAQHDGPCAALCAAMGHGVAGPLPPAATAVAAMVREALPPVPVDDWVRPHRFLGGPQIPRGPPLP
jgi:hypothetical protein